MTQLVCIFALLVFFLTGTICAQDSSSASQELPRHDDIAVDRIINDLAEMWQRQDDELINGKVDLLLFRFAGTQIPIQNFDALKILTDEIGKCQDVQQITEFMDDVWLPKVREFKPAFDKRSSVWGTEVNAAFDGKMARAKWRNMENFEPEYLSLPTAFVTWNSQFKTYTIELASNQEMFTQNSLRLAPAREARIGSIISGRPISPRQYEVELNANRMMICDREDGFVSVLTRERNEGGLDFWLQYGKLESGIPRVFIDGVISDGHLLTFGVRFVESIQTNLDLGRNAFTLLAETDSKILDYRFAKDQVRIFPAGPGDDILYIANRTAEAPTTDSDVTRSTGTTPSRSKAAAVLNAAMVFGVGFVLSLILVVVGQKLKSRFSYRKE